MKTAIALSGGADSLASLLFLRERGYDLFPFHARLIPGNGQQKQIEEQLNLICQKLGLTLYVLDLTVDFEQIIINPFISSYLCGLTPNPCALCNRQIKFGLIFNRLKELDVPCLATGHYARITREDESLSLWRAHDKTKDQSYFLSMVPINVFSRVIFPLQETNKVQVLDFLKQNNISPPVRKESNEICFIRSDYREFITSRVQDSLLAHPGPVKDSQGSELGRHQGLWRYTQGQRRGLGIAHHHPLYVLRKNHETNTLVVGSHEELLTGSCRAGQLNLHTDPDLWPEKVFVQTRYRQNAGRATVKIHSNRMFISFSRGRDIPAPGQVAAVYSRQGQILGAGIIENTEPE